MAIDSAVKSLAPIRNPANRTQRFDVLELWGHVYKGHDRIRLIYAQPGSECVLMGQEILDTPTCERRRPPAPGVAEEDLVSRNYTRAWRVRVLAASVRRRSPSRRTR